MSAIRKALPFFAFMWVAVLFAGIFSTAAAQSDGHDFDPCGSGLGSQESALSIQTHWIGSHGLIPAGHSILYDSNQGVCWLADANLAGSPQLQAELGVAGINPDGTMDYPTAVKWVNALNQFNNGKGFLGHNNWQLPNNPQFDSTCSAANNGSFGATCTGSALGYLYKVGLDRTFPDSVDPDFDNKVWPFRNLQPALYWTSDQNSGGEVTFSFNTGLNGANTTKYNFFHVLPMALGAIGKLPEGSGVVAYTNGLAAGKAVYDTATGISWTLDANLAARQTFGIKGTTTITSSVDGSVLTVPLIDEDGAMLFSTIDLPGGWLAAMNQDGYAGTSGWMIPSLSDLRTLYQDLQLQPGDTRLEAQGRAGLFQNFQPAFYWACERDPGKTSQAPCDPNLNPGVSPNGTLFRYSFDFDNGFEGTDLETKQFYVMVYFPAPIQGH
jgi:hypothetical protein